MSKNIAIFISGRIIGYEECLLPLINNIKNKYNIFLFFSINSFSLDKDNQNEKNIEEIIKKLKNDFGKNFADAHFKEYKLPKIFVDNRKNNNIFNFNYNELSHNYNDKKNFELIKKYENENNISFDLICKLRSDIIVYNNNIDFIFDNENELIIRNKHMQDIRYWGGIFTDTPLMISDSFAYGNKKSMEIYCSTYDWILKNDLLFNGNYTYANEIFLTDNLLQYVFYHNDKGRDNNPYLSREQVIDKYINNPYGIKIITLNDIHYVLLNENIRKKNNFIVDINNVYEYTEKI